MDPPAPEPPPTGSREPIAVEVFSDLVCPWCYIGKRRFETALVELRADPGFDLAVDVVYRPFQLDLRAPRGLAEPAIDVYARKFGGAEAARRIIDHVTAAAAAEGLEFHLDRAVRSNTADAHRLLWWTLAHHGREPQAELKEALLRAYFTEEADVGDRAVLLERAVRCGLPADDVAEVLDGETGLEALAVGMQRCAELGITAVPTYVVDGRWSIPGAQDPAVFVAALRRFAAKRAA
jgi:predicted DsbA family dithiol-disulfide isomerase